jgi:7-carboxy-7-deazaguanine synthase
MDRPDPTRLLVAEVFASLQGESSWAGLPCVFIRLAGCPLRCRWCDTPQAREGGEAWTLEALLEKVRSFGLPLVEVTGGEPLAQAGCLPLLERLVDAGYRVLLETSGALDITPVPETVVRIVDVKCPGSGEAERNRWENLSTLRLQDEVKFVVQDEVDYDYARDVMARYDLPSKCGILLSPVEGCLDRVRLAEWMLRDRSRARMNLQLHKILWGPRATGR